MGHSGWSYKSSPLLLARTSGCRATNCHEFSHGRSSGRSRFNGRKNTYVYVCVRLTASAKSATLHKEPRRLGYPKLLRVVRAFASEFFALITGRTELGPNSRGIFRRPNERAGV